MTVSNGKVNHATALGSPDGDVDTTPKDNSAVVTTKSGRKPSLLNSGVECAPDTMTKHSFASLVGLKQGSSVSNSHMTPTSVLDVYSSASDSVLVPSSSSCLPGTTMGSIKLEVSQRAGIATNLQPELAEPLSLPVHDDLLIVNSSNLESHSSLQFTDLPKGTTTTLLHNFCNSLNIVFPNYINGVGFFSLTIYQLMLL